MTNALTKDDLKDMQVISTIEVTKIVTAIVTKAISDNNVHIQKMIDASIAKNNKYIKTIIDDSIAKNNEFIKTMIDDSIAKNNQYVVKIIDVSIGKAVEDITSVLSRYASDADLKVLKRDDQITKHDRWIKELAFKTKTTLI